MAVSEMMWVMINLYKKCLPVITWNKRHSSQQVVSMIYKLGEDFFGAAPFKGLSDVSPQTCNKLYSILWSRRVFFAFLRKRRPNRYWL